VPHRRLLALDTLGPSLSAALDEGGAVLAERSETPERGGQAERILPLAEGLLAGAGWGWRDLDLIAVTVGPGGFTAVRTGVALARALALALDRPVAAVGTLEAVAEAAVALDGPGPLLALKDLHRGGLAAQAFAADLAPAAGVRLLVAGGPEVLAALAGAPRLAAGEGALVLATMPGLGKAVVEAPPSARYVAAAARRRAARGEAPVAGTEVRPLYLRPADARPAAGRPLVGAPGAATAAASAAT
jgi:tRNA threonylcarbamoyladenosine biosynthesis protein TsaB